MKLSKRITDAQRKSLLSTLWIFVLLNMVYADILGTLRPGYIDMLNQLSQQLTGSMVLLFAVLMEVAIGMVLLSRILPYKANRWAHFAAIPLIILWVVVPALVPTTGDATPLSYIFFAAVEVATMLVIFVFVWKWPRARKESRRESL